MDEWGSMGRWPPQNRDIQKDSQDGVSPEKTVGKRNDEQRDRKGKFDLYPAEER